MKTYKSLPPLMRTASIPLSTETVSTEYNKIEQKLNNISGNENVFVYKHTDHDINRSKMNSLTCFQSMTDDITLSKHGYKKVNTIGHHVQGEIIKCSVNSHDLMKNKEKNVSVNKGNVHRYVTIKKTEKKLYREKIGIEDGMNILTDENIVKESLILQHLTVTNKPIGDYIISFIDFFQDQYSYYLVMEYIHCITLTEFVEKAHQFINKKQLKIKEWKKICRWIFWQISAMIYWFHNDLNCCHLDLTMDNIMIQNANFVETKDGLIQIDTKCSIKIQNFGRSEMFPSNNFKCDKYSIIGYSHLKSPQFNAEDIYNAKKADIWSLGMILYTMTFGRRPYRYPDDTDSGYKAIMNTNIVGHVKANNLVRYIDTNLLLLISGCLGYEEHQRFNITNIVHHQWLSRYYAVYQRHIHTKSAKQLSEKKIITFPYYSI